ncbi:EF-hand domain-containing protein [Cupriavidus basilensis]|uniref:EF-hand domain-containing protein n=1 Tax=Cupriavidus basilensis TaxID=68895 RepID=A0ABT6B3C0_9BURK|nr:EF-hand domain-containing protein [Cupriavidus basilensis]MDF3839374.1 EF-hand domain-containing protein [Cupriavidus basilensis]
MQATLKTRAIRKFLAASAVFLAVGGTAFAQAADPAPAPQSGMDQHKWHGHEHGGMWFKMMDTNHDGVITKAEYDALFKRIDTNHDGKLDKAELAAFRKTMMEQRRAEMQARFEARFKAADKNGDGALTKEEVQAAMPRLAKHFDELDTNHDGKLTMDEIRAGMMKMHEQRMHRDGQAMPGAPSSRGG